MQGSEPRSKARSKTPNLPDAASRPLRSYGRVRGRKHTAHQQLLLDTLLPRLHISLPDSADATLELAPLFPLSPQRIWLEIGYGAGEHLAAQAVQHPDVGLIGCEVFENGIASLLSRIDKAQIGNIRLFSGDARLLLEALPDGSLARAFVLFPDPWPKTKHHKRRLITADFLTEMHRVLTPGGTLFIATDHMPYARWILAQYQKLSCFEWRARTSADWLNPPAGHTTTRYESKLKAGTRPVYLEFVAV